MDVGLSLRDLRATGRLAAFAHKLGSRSEHEAIGVLADFYLATQSAKIARAARRDIASAIRVYLFNYDANLVMDSLVAAGLADDHGDELVIRGAQAHLDRIEAHRATRAAGGQKRAATAQRGPNGRMVSSKQPAASQQDAGQLDVLHQHVQLGSWIQDPGSSSNTQNPPPASAGVPPQGGPLSLDALREKASEEFENRGQLVTIEQAKALQQPGRDTETNARSTRQLEPFALAMLAELCDAQTPPIIRPAVWDRQDHRNISKLVGKYPAQEQWRAILTHYVTDPRWAWLGGARPTKWLAEHIDDVAGRALGAEMVSGDPIAEGLKYAEECERLERERNKS